MHRRVVSRLALAALFGAGLAFGAMAQAPAVAPSATPPSPPPPAATPPKTTPAPSTPAPQPPPTATPAAPPNTPVTPGDKSPSATPSDKTPGAPSPSVPPAAPAPDKTPPAPKTDKPAEKLAPDTKPENNEIEPNGSPGVPSNATTETVDVPPRPIVMVNGKSSYDDAFKSIKASIDTVTKAMEKAGLKPAGHPITIFSEPDKDGFKYLAAVPIAAKPDKTPDLGADVTIGDSPSGTAIKFQHRGGYEDIDSTYDVITTFLDAKGLQVDSPYIEEYLTDLTTPDDPNLQVDIYVFEKH